MTPSSKCIDFIKLHEGCLLHTYPDDGGVWTIGYGTIEYPDGRKVKKGDVITKGDALECLQHEIDLKAAGVNKAIGNIIISQNQFDALVSFAYNEGIGALNVSTLLKKLKVNPNDPSIRDEFLKWTKIKVNGKYVDSEGLRKRRKEEADLYFNTTT